MWIPRIVSTLQWHSSSSGGAFREVCEGVFNLKYFGHLRGCLCLRRGLCPPSPTPALNLPTLENGDRLHHWQVTIATNLSLNCVTNCTYLQLQLQQHPLVLTAYRKYCPLFYHHCNSYKKKKIIHYTLYTSLEACLVH